MSALRYLPLVVWLSCTPEPTPPAPTQPTPRLGVRGTEAHVPKVAPAPREPAEAFRRATMRQCADILPRSDVDGAEASRRVICMKVMLDDVLEPREFRCRQARVLDPGAEAVNKEARGTTPDLYKRIRLDMQDLCD